MPPLGTRFPHRAVEARRGDVGCLQGGETGMESSSKAGSLGRRKERAQEPGGPAAS